MLREVRPGSLLATRRTCTSLWPGMVAGLGDELGLIVAVGVSEGVAVGVLVGTGEGVGLSVALALPAGAGLSTPEAGDAANKTALIATAAAREAVIGFMHASL